MKKRYFFVPEGATEEETESARILHLCHEVAIEKLKAGEITPVIGLDEKTREWEIVLAASGCRISDLPFAALTIKSVFLHEKMIPVKEYIQGIVEDVKAMKARNSLTKKDKKTGETNGTSRQN